jgi:beta-xylosidase
MIRRRAILLSAAFCAYMFSFSQSPVWMPDKGDGNYVNPIIHADYSDPDVVRVNDDYYMISSSFNHVPGIPILHSNDLVNCKLIGHALKDLVLEWAGVGDKRKRFD